MRIWRQNEDKLFRWWSSKRKYALYLHCLYNYWFCYENGQKNYPQVYLEECKYRVKKIQMSRFINPELESDSESDSEAESKSDTKLMAKLKSGSDSE